MRERGGREVKAGEFVLGYPNEYGLLTDRPLLAPAADPAGLLPARGRHGRADLGRNGSYLVLRTLRQDVDAFHAFTDTATRDAAGRPDPDAGRRCSPRRSSAAGRAGHRWCWHPATTTRRSADSNDFGYHAVRRPRPGLPARLARPADQPARLARAAARAPRPRWRSTAGTGCCGAAAATARRRRGRSAACTSSASTRTWPGSTSSSSTPGSTTRCSTGSRTRPTRWSGARSAKRSYFTTPARPGTPPLHGAAAVRARPRRRLLLPARHPRAALPGRRPAASHHLTRGRPMSNSTVDTGGSGRLPRHAVLAGRRRHLRAHRPQGRVGPAAQGAQPRRADRPARHAAHASTCTTPTRCRPPTCRRSPPPDAAST